MSDYEDFKLAGMMTDDAMVIHDVCGFLVGHAATLTDAIELVQDHDCPGGESE